MTPFKEIKELYDKEKAYFIDTQICEHPGNVSNDSRGTVGLRVRDGAGLVFGLRVWII